MASKFFDLQQSTGVLQTVYIMTSRRLSQTAEQLRLTRQEIGITAENKQNLLGDQKALMEKIQYFNSRAVGCIESQQWEQALVFLQSAQHLLEAATQRGQLVDQVMVQCILQNQACCFQNLWQLQQCSNYIQALIFNLNNKKNDQNTTIASQSRKEEYFSRYGLARYYLQFCAVNSQIGNHSGALVSARKALTIIRRELTLWDRYLDVRPKSKKDRSQYEEKARTLETLTTFNDHIDLQASDTLMQATSYYLKLHYLSLSSTRNNSKDVRYLIQNFTMKIIMQIKSTTHQDYLDCFQRECQMTLFGLQQRVFILSVCYFTMATQLRLIAMDKGKQSSNQRSNTPQQKEAEVYHLFAILVVVLTVNIQSHYLGHLLSTYHSHYGHDLASMDVPFKKIFAEVIAEPKKIREVSIICSEEGLLSHLSKGSGTMARFTKSSKQSEHAKFSFLDPKKRRKKSKSKSKQKTKRKSTNSKSKKQSSSLSKSPYSRSPRPKDSLLLKSPRSPRSKQSIGYKSPLNSLKHISNPLRNNLIKDPTRKNTQSKSKKKSKIQGNMNEYFLQKKEDRKRKKTSISSKKSSIHPKSMSKLPLHSTLEAKEGAPTHKEKKKMSKKNLLQHYL